MNRERLLRVLRGPHVSEKSTAAGEVANQYVFRVDPRANKDDIRDAVQLVFDVHVTGVRVINVKGKNKRFKTHAGRRSNWKKAYVRLVEGEQIDLGGGE